LVLSTISIAWCIAGDELIVGYIQELVDASPDMHDNFAQVINVSINILNRLALSLRLHLRPTG
jgi:hypothetical protein